MVIVEDDAPALGLSTAIQLLGGVSAGIYQAEFQTPQSKWESNQGSFIVIVHVAHFMPMEKLKEQMDRYVGDARQMLPFPGLPQTELPGGLEWQWQQDNEGDGAPIAPAHQQLLEEVAAELGGEVPFAEYEDTRW